MVGCGREPLRGSFSRIAPMAVFRLKGVILHRCCPTRSDGGYAAERAWGMGGEIATTVFEVATLCEPRRGSRQPNVGAPATTLGNRNRDVHQPRRGCGRC